MVKTNLVQRCRQGSMPIKEFFEYAVWQVPRRTHLLKVGDYVVSPHPTQEDVIVLDRIAELDSPEKGDFVTERGASGPINGSVFVYLDKNNYHPAMLIEGDRLYTGKDSVADSLRRYLEKTQKSA